MAQPQWITPAGSLGTIPEGVFYSDSVEAVADGQDVFFRLISGELPDGIQVSANGTVEGIPKTVTRVQGVPTQVSRNVESRFAIRAYTIRTVNGQTVIDRLADRTFTLTVVDTNNPRWETPAGNIGTFYDGTEADIQLVYSGLDADEAANIVLISGQLPPGMVLDPTTGLISGVIEPLTGPGAGVPAGYDLTPYAQYPFDFSTRSASQNYQFTLQIKGNKTTTIDPESLRTFEIFVYSKDSMTADTTDFTADNTFITADVSPVRTPILLTPPGDLGRVRADNFYAFKFDAIDFDGDPIEYSVTVGAGIGFDPLPRDNIYNFQPGSFDYTGEGFDRGTFSLPPGLAINPDTGWFYGYIPDQGATEQTYRFAVRVYKRDNPTVISDFYYFTITIIGDIDTEVVWLTPEDLGTINNGAISTLYVAATNRGGRSLQYRIESGSNSRLPEGLTLQSTGEITGRVSFNTFALDGGTTTFDVDLNTRLDIDETTFDTKFEFTVNAFASETEQIGYQVGGITVTNGGSGYTDQPTITISAPPNTENAIQATAGPAVIVGGVIQSISVGNPGRGYTSAPTITITGGGGTGAVATSSITEAEISNAISVFRRFTVQVIRAFNEPYETLYIKCMPPRDDRDIVEQLTQNQDILPIDLIYRLNDPNFGIAKSVIYNHAYGLRSAAIEDYVASLDENHYWRNITLGEIKVAQALNPDGSVLYEVIYSEIVDDLINNQGVSVGKEVELPYPINAGDSTEISTVYPNSLVNMRNQVVDTVGQITPGLPLWMTSKQTNGQVLGFTPAWVIAYIKPGQGARVRYLIAENFQERLNKIDFKVDRYEIDRSQTYQWNSTTDKWDPQPPAATTFDQFTQSSQLVGWTNNSGLTVLWENISDRVLFWITPPSGIPETGTIFDGGATRFITPTVRWTNTDAFDKYLVFPKRNILE